MHNPRLALAAFAAAFTQHNRLIRIRFAPDSNIPENLLLPWRMKGSEHISQCYRYELECLSANETLALKTLLGQPIQIDLRQPDGTMRRISGLVTATEHRGPQGDFQRYALIIEPALAVLAHRTTSRVFQDISVPDIVHTLVAEQRAKNTVISQSFTLENRLRRRYSPRHYCVAYRESEQHFIERLLAEEGISYCFRFQDTNGAPTHTLVLFDATHAIAPDAQTTLHYRRADPAGTLTHWHARRQILSTRTTLVTFDEQVNQTWQSDYSANLQQGPAGQALGATLEDYDPQTLRYAEDNDALRRHVLQRQDATDQRTKTFTGRSTVRSLYAGGAFLLEQHPAHQRDSIKEREFLITSLELIARNNLPSEVAPPEETPAYTNHFTAVRRATLLAPPFRPKPTAPGPQTAIVVGPQGEAIYTDEQGRIKIQFHWQRREDHPDGGANKDERSSTWVRVMSAVAGHTWGQQYLPRIGQEVMVQFIEGDIDRPVVIGGLHNFRNDPVMFSDERGLPANKALSGVQSKELGGRGYNELVFDDTQGQLRAKLSTEHAKTQLNQGYLIHPRREGKGVPRGEGYELVTEAAGAIRALSGLLVSADKSSGNQLSREALRQVLESVTALSEQLATHAEHQHANAPDLGPQNRLKAAIDALEHGTNTDKTSTPGQASGKGVIAFSAPNGIAIATPSNTTVAAGSLDQIAQHDTHQTSGKRWVHNVGESISLFVAGTKARVKDTLKLIAAQGGVRIEAHGGPINVTAQQDLTITSVNGKLVISAPNEILLAAGGGYIRVGKDIDIHNPGKLSQKAAGVSLGEPTTMLPSLPVFPNSEMAGKHSLRFAFDGTDELVNELGLVGKDYSILNAKGEKLMGGVIPQDGRFDRILLDEGSELQLIIGDPNNWRKVESTLKNQDLSSAHLADNQDDLDNYEDPYFSQLATQHEETEFLSHQQTEELFGIKSGS